MLSRASVFVGIAVVILGAGGARQSIAQTVQTGSISALLDTVATLPTGTTGSPLWGTNAGDSRLFVVGQRGQIRIVDSSGLVATPFLEVSPALASQGFTFINPSNVFDERGLLGIAFHPDYATAGNPGSGKFYTFTNENPGGAGGNAPTFATPEVSGNGTVQSVVREWSVSAGNPNLANAATSRVLFRIRKVQNNHNAGAMVFGPDGYLYVAIGDGGGGFDASSENNVNDNADGHTNAPGPNPNLYPHGNAQDITNPFGKILRIKPTTDAEVGPALTTLSTNSQYRVPNDNPFAGATTGLDEIFAYGLRNPFRISFDRTEGDLYAADVGQLHREEVDVIINGGNYGWVVKEGTIDTQHNDTMPPPPPIPDYNFSPSVSSPIDPIAEYSHTYGIAVIGGFVYRGDKFPELTGKYVFGELGGPGGNLGRLFYMDVDNPGLNQIYEFLISPSGEAKPLSPLHGFGEGSNGEIYAMFRNGQIVEIIPEPATWVLAVVGTALVGCRGLRRLRAQ